MTSMHDDEPTRTKGSTETCIHREGRGNWTQVEHMRTGADNHKTSCLCPVSHPIEQML